MFINQAKQIRSAWIIISAFILMFVGQAIFMVPPMLLFIFDNSLWATLIIQGSGTLGGLIATMLTWKYINKRKIIDLGFTRHMNHLFFGLLLGTLSIILMFIILLLSKNVILIHPLSEPNFDFIIISYFIFFILIGIFEETFFRGYVIKTLHSRNVAPWFIYVISALFFSMVHGINPNVSFLGLVNILLVGLLFAYMFLTTNNLWLPIGFHITWNFFQGNIFGFSVSGIETKSIYAVDTTIGNDLLTGGSFGLEGSILTTIVLILSFFITKIYLQNVDHFIDKQL